jgi:hypothetical protein
VKLLGVSFEREGYFMFAIVPKDNILKSSKNDDDQDVKYSDLIQVFTEKHMAEVFAM